MEANPILRRHSACAVGRKLNANFAADVNEWSLTCQNRALKYSNIQQQRPMVNILIFLPTSEEDRLRISKRLHRYRFRFTILISLKVAPQVSTSHFSTGSRVKTSISPDFSAHLGHKKLFISCVEGNASLKESAALRDSLFWRV